MNENFVREFVTKLDGKISDDDLKTVLHALQLFTSDYDINHRETELVPYNSKIPKCYSVYLVSKKIEGMAPSSMKTYDMYLKHFFENVGRSFEDVTTDDIRIYLYELQMSRRISNHTLDERRLVLNTFLDWCWKEGYLEFNPCAPIGPIRFDQKLIQPLTGLEMEALRDACESYRDKAMIELFYSTGCRLAEMANLKISDIDFYTKEVRLFGKGSKHRVSYLNAKAEYALTKYFELERSKEATNDSVFLINRRPYTGMKREGLYMCIKRLQKRSGIQRSIFPHLLRHTMATDALNRGMALVEVQGLLGHARIDTTLIYAKVSDESIKYSHKRYIV